MVRLLFVVFKAVGWFRRDSLQISDTAHLSSSAERWAIMSQRILHISLQAAPTLCPWTVNTCCIVPKHPLPGQLNQHFNLNYICIYIKNTSHQNKSINTFTSHWRPSGGSCSVMYTWIIPITLTNSSLLCTIRGGRQLSPGAFVTHERPYWHFFYRHIPLRRASFVLFFSSIDNPYTSYRGHSGKEL